MKKILSLSFLVLSHSAINCVVSYALSPSTIDFIQKNLPKGSTILELGSGVGTEELSQSFKMISIEDDKNWVGRYNSTYIYAPLTKNGWYDRSILEKMLPPKNAYDALIIDGPQRGSRIPFLDNLDLFNLDCLIIIDDTDQQKNKALTNFLPKHLGRKLVTITTQRLENGRLRTAGAILPKSAK